VDVAGVHPLVEQVDRLALAGAAHAGDENHHRKAALLGEVELRVQEIGAQLGLNTAVLFLG